MAIKDSLNKVQGEIVAACARAGRDVSEVTLIAVSKTKPVEDLKAAYDAGAICFGENRVQELLAKQPQLPADIRWHMIGHLQTNKVKQLIGKCELIHSVDSLHLAEEIDKQARAAGIVQDILLEVNVAGEESKFGSGDLAENAALARQICALPNLRLCGLMTVAPFVEDAEENREVFRTLCRFADEELKDILPADRILSMGMSGDYTVAVEEGATHVRVGSAIFGAR